MESYNPIKRKDLEPEDTNQSKHVKLSNESDHSIQLSTPTCNQDPAISFDEQTLVWVKQLLGVQEDSNATKNIDSQNNDQLLSIDPEILHLLHIDEQILPLSSNNENNFISLYENDDMQYVQGLHVNSEGAKLFRTDLVEVIKEFEKNNDTVNASKYRNLLHQASEYSNEDIVWFTGDKIGFKATEEEIKTNKNSPVKPLGTFKGFYLNYCKLRRKTVQSIPVRKPDQSNESINRSINRVIIRPLNYPNETQKDNREISSAQIDDMQMQYVRGLVNTEGAKLFRTDLIAVIKEF